MGSLVTKGYKELEIEGMELHDYQLNMSNSQVMKDLYLTRNVKGGFKKGRYMGVLNAGLISFITKGREGWNLRNNGTDSAKTGLASQHEKIDYSDVKKDGKLTFDL